MGRSRIVIHEGAINKLTRETQVKADLERRAQAVADAANAQSSWGGYHCEVESTPDGPVARVWNVKAGAADDESRNQRMIRSLDSAR